MVTSSFYFLSQLDNSCWSHCLGASIVDHGCKVTITWSPRFFFIDATLLCESESDKI